MDRYDIFLSYASEDRQDIAAPLTQALTTRGLRVWSDERMLAAGAELSRSISAGLSSCSYGVVILSRAYMGQGKYWPRQELQGLMAREEEEGSLIIPIWHKVGRQDVIAFNPPLAGRKALVSPDQSIEEMSDSILRVIRPAVAQPPQTESQEKAAAPPRPPRRRRARSTIAFAPDREKRNTGAAKPEPQPAPSPESEPPPSRPAHHSSLGFADILHTVSIQEIHELIENGITSVTFCGFSDFSPESAALLARWGGSHLHIDRFWNLTPAVLAELVCWKGETLILGLRELPAEWALLLSRWPGRRLEIHTLQQLEPEAAAHLAAWPGQYLVFAGLRDLPGEAASALSHWPGHELSFLWPRGRMSSEAAGSLAAWPGTTLVLTEALSPTEAKQLARWQGQVLDLRGLTSLSAASARALYRWRGDEIRLSLWCNVGDPARHYLDQWGKESEKIWRRRQGIPAEPEEFGFIPALRRIWAGTANLESSRRQAASQPAPAQIQEQGAPERRRRARKQWSLAGLVGSRVLFFLALVGLLVWLLASSWTTGLSAILTVPGRLEPAWWHGTLRFLSFVARLVLALLPPVLTVAWLILGWDFLEPKWKEVVEDEERARRYGICWDVLWTGANIALTAIVLWWAMRAFFPGFLTLESLRRALVESRAGTPLLPEDGFWHGLLNLPRTLLVRFPPHAEAAGAWLLYFPAYLLGLAVSVVGVVAVLHLPLALLTGFDSRKSAYVERRSHYVYVILALVFLYLLWCVALLLWAVVAAVIA